MVGWLAGSTTGLLVDLLAGWLVSSLAVWFVGLLTPKSYTLMFRWQ